MKGQSFSAWRREGEQDEGGVADPREVIYGNGRASKISRQDSWAGRDQTKANWHISIIGHDAHLSLDTGAGAAEARSSGVVSLDSVSSQVLPVRSGWTSRRRHGGKAS